MIETAKRYDEKHIRHQGVTRSYEDLNGRRKALSYSSLNHTVTFYAHGRRVDSHSFDTVYAAREYFRQMQAMIENVDGYRRIN